MTRKELFESVKKNSLQDAIKAMYGTDYTHVSNAELEKFITFRKKEKKGNSTTENSEDTQEPVMGFTKVKAVQLKEENPFRMTYLSTLLMLKAQGLLDDLLKEVESAFDNKE